MKLFVLGADDESSECGLDDYEDWDWKFTNDDHENPEELETFLTNLTKHIEENLKSWKKIETSQ